MRSSVASYFGSLLTSVYWKISPNPVVIGPSCDIDSSGQAIAQRLEPFEHQLAREVIVHAVFEDDRDRAQTDLRDGAHFLESRQTAHLHFDRAGDELFDFGRRHATCGREHLHLHVGHVGKGVDRNLLQREHTETGETTIDRG